MFVVSQTEAEANSAKTMKTSPTPRVNKFIHKVGLCLDRSDRVTLLGGGPYLLANRLLYIYVPKSVLTPSSKGISSAILKRSIISCTVDCVFLRISSHCSLK